MAHPGGCGVQGLRRVGMGKSIQHSGTCRCCGRSTERHWFYKDERICIYCSSCQIAGCYRGAAKSCPVKNRLRSSPVPGAGIVGEDLGDRGDGDMDGD